VFDRSVKPSHSPGAGSLRKLSSLSCPTFLSSRTNWRALGRKFVAYYDRGEFPRGELSRAEFGLCMLLTFWFNCNPEAIDRVFRRSALFKPARWDRPLEDTTGVLQSQINPS
jgi:primase-polymerase (primpol)-like protein